MPYALIAGADWVVGAPFNLAFGSISLVRSIISRQRFVTSCKQKPAAERDDVRIP
jgi:hypothetical protein